MNKRRTRHLRHGEAIPAGTPRRYLRKNGYVLLRWKLAPNEFVEAYEHRAIMGLPAAQVHHQNTVKTDNRADNLQVVTPSEHAHIHHPAAWVDEAAVLYRNGWSTTRLAKHFGLFCAGNVSRALRKVGVVMRDSGCGQRRAAPVERVRELYLRGFRAPVVARYVGSTPTVVRRVIRDLGLTPHRVGRPPKSLEASS